MKYKGSSPMSLEVDSLSDFFRREIDEGSPNILCVGPSGIGKSESMLELIRLICPTFNLEQDLIFTLEEFWDKIDKGKNRRWCCKLLDDFGSELDATRGMTNEARDIIHYLQTIRTDHIALFITTPVKGFLNKDIRDRIADYFIEIKRKNKTAKFSQGVIHYKQRNNVIGKTYHHSLCIDGRGLINNKDRGTKAWGWVFYPPPKEIHEAYLPLRASKADANREKGQKSSRKLRDKMQTEAQTVEKIMDKIGEYIKINSRGKPVLNKDLIGADYELGDRPLKRICAKIEQIRAKNG